jgi:isopentenyl diphosphate isomerase/L-lactate dehydrogenase-like FMN-dependent dehydrogenase
MRAELDTTMALLGVTRVADINRATIVTDPSTL